MKQIVIAYKGKILMELLNIKSEKDLSNFLWNLVAPRKEEVEKYTKKDLDRLCCRKCGDLTLDMGQNESLCQNCV